MQNEKNIVIVGFGLNLYLHGGVSPEARSEDPLTRRNAEADRKHKRENETPGGPVADIQKQRGATTAQDAMRSYSSSEDPLRGRKS